jgi:hypothetical protein
MAITVSTIYKDVEGSLRVNILSCTAGTSSGNIDTGLSNVYAYDIAPVSMATAGVNATRNVGSGATARAGILNVNSFAVGDVFIVKAYGK